VADISDQEPTLSENSPVQGGEELAAASARVLENLAELEPELVSAGIFDESGKTLALTSDSPGWDETASELLAALAAESGEEEPDSAHIASAEGEVFVVHEAGLSLIAVTGRFVLASLTVYDMRMALRDATGSIATNPAAKAKNTGSNDA